MVVVRGVRVVVPQRTWVVLKDVRLYFFDGCAYSLDAHRSPLLGSVLAEDCSHPRRASSSPNIPMMMSAAS